MKHTIVHKKTKDKIYVNLNIPIITINDREIKTLDIRDMELFYLIVEANPNTLNYNEIKTKLLKKYNISCDYTDPLLYIRKKKHNILKNIEDKRKNKSLPTLIDTIPTVGYRLNKDWEKENSPIAIKASFPTGLNVLIDHLGQIMEEAIILEESIPLHEIEIEGDVIITLNTDGFSKQIDILQHKYLKSTVKLLKTLNLTPFENKYVLIESVLRLIRSYISMSRQGAGITHKEWRTMFNDELRHHFRNLIMLIQS